MSAPPFTGDLRTWARQVQAFLNRTLSRLEFKTAQQQPAENGVLVWDEENGYPVVSKDGVWREVVLANGYYNGQITANQTAAAINTAYALTYTAINNSGIANGTPSSRIVFDEGGEYIVSFSAQISSSSASTVNFWFWPRINGVNVSGSTMKNALHQNGATLVVTRTAIFQISAGDYLEAMWAVNSTSGILEAAASTAFSPAAPASTISISRVHA